MSAEIPDTVIDALVDKFMEHHNVKFLPDTIEKKAYTIVVKSFLSGCQKLLDEASVKLPGCKLKLQVVPDSS